MKTSLAGKTVLTLLGAGAAGAMAGIYLIAPSRAKKEQLAPFYKRTFAHRGLYSKDQSVPENSLPAFRAAVEAGYGFELDVQLSKDGQVVVFHDDDLLRGCGEDAPVSSKTLEELRTLPLFGTKERIPLFTEVLEIAGGRVPIIVELKSAGPKNIELAQKTAEILAAYDGPYCIESFDPRIVRYFRLFLPWVLRGQLANPPKRYGKSISPLTAKALANVMADFLSRPQFIAYEVGPLPFPVKLAHRLGAANVRWTCRAPGDDDGADLFIFEHWLPPQNL